jgi:hypothetical protein
VFCLLRNLFFFFLLPLFFFFFFSPTVFASLTLSLVVDNQPTPLRSYRNHGQWLDAYEVTRLKELHRFSGVGVGVCVYFFLEFHEPLFRPPSPSFLGDLKPV